MTKVLSYLKVESDMYQKLRPYLRFVPPLLILVPLVLASVLAPFLPLKDPTATNILNTNAPPSLNHWLGTDGNGMDIFSRTIYAARLDLVMALSAVSIGSILGGLAGATSGYIGGITENIIERLAEMIQGFPYILFGMLVAILLGKGPITLITVLAIYNFPFYAKLVRSEVKSLKNEAFVQAAIAAGVKPHKIIFKHLIPNALPAIFGQFPLSSASAIRFVAALSFLGLGVSPPTPEWGAMIQVGAESIIFGRWWISAFPGLALFAVVWSLNNLGTNLQRLLGRES